MSIAFDAPEQSLFGKMGRTVVDDGIETDLYQKGSGLQRAVAYAAIRVYAEQQKAAVNTDSDSRESAGTLPGSSLFLCVDEPEIWMHPKAQQALAQALADISQNEQVIVSTHSPYILQAFNRNVSVNSESLFIFNDDKTSENRVMKSTDFGCVHPNRPSLAEITYEAFQIPTPEFHSELYGMLQRKIQNSPIFSNENESKVTLGKVDTVLRDTRIALSEQEKKSYSRFNSAGRKKGVWTQSVIAHETLPTYIRNIIDHPESINVIDEAIEYFSNHPSRDVDVETLKNLKNEYTHDQLEESIKILLRVLHRMDE